VVFGLCAGTCPDFLESQSRGIHQFEEARKEKRMHDWFFDTEALRTRSRDGKILHSSVSD